MNKVITVKNPYTGEIIQEIDSPDKDQVDLYLNESKQYYEKVFKKIPSYLRAEILYKVSDLININRDELSKLISSEGGKPLKDAVIEVERAVNTVKMSANFALELNGEQISMDRAKGSENHIAFTIRESLGVVLAISAFNHPVNLICHQIATAIAAGNTVIIKPAEKTPLSALKICEFFWNSGLNKSALIYLPITGAETENIITNKNINYISFIGHSSIGWMIKKSVLPGVKVVLEHGGTASAIIDEEIEIESTVNSLIRGAFYHSGQVCVSTQIAYIHSNIYDKFIEILINRVNSLKVGNPLELDNDCGPLITSEVVKNMESLISDALSQGAKIICGGKKLSNNCFTPTVITNVTRKMKVISEEVFGPILSITKYKNLNEVLEEINSSKFAFQTAIYTKNIDRALFFAKEVDQKACIINDSTAFRVDWMPFGGYKHSGYGIGGIKYAIEDMTKEKLIIIKNQKVF